MAAYPVQLDVYSPQRFDRIQLLIRIALSVFLGWLGITAGLLMGVLYFALPIFAAIIVSTRGTDTYVHATSQKLWPVLRWLLAFFAYMLLLTDRVPVDEQTGVRAELQPTGRPTVGSTLLRLLLSIPSAFVLALLGIVSSILWLVGLVTILVNHTVPASILSFQTGFLRWHARLLAYHASFVDEYPPFALHDQPAAPAPASVAS